MRPQRLPVCDEPTLFAQAMEVCGNCGNLLDAHTRQVDDPARQRTKEAMWKVLLTHGAPHCQYHGGPSPERGQKLHQHLETCAINWKHTEEPKMGDATVFNGTFTENGTVHLLIGELWCKCGEYQWAKITVEDMTLSQLIWHVAHLDDKD